MTEIKKHPKGCTDLKRLYDKLGKEEKAERRKEYLERGKQQGGESGKVN